MILSNLVYLKKYDRATGEKSDCGVPKVSTKAFVILTGLQSITELLNQGIGTSLSEIRDMINLDIR